MKSFQLVVAALTIVSLAYVANAIDFGKVLGAGGKVINETGNAIASGHDIAHGVLEHMRKRLPTPKGLFELKKEIIAGLPFQFVFRAVNAICSAAVTAQKIKPRTSPGIKKMQFQLRTACNRYSYPLLQAEDMWKSPEFDANKKVVILATGWTTEVNATNTIDELAKAYNCRGDTNFVALDAAHYVDTLYTWSSFNTEEIGKNMAEGLIKLIEIVPLENIHLIGHSLGAHIVGSAGRYFNEKTGKSIPRITGLDPANPCFNEGENLGGLQRGDADFIDIVHSNPGVLGQKDPLGDVDFYPGGLDALAPGCIEIICSHARSWWYYTETVYPGNENNFMGKRCTSLTKMRQDKCPGKEQAMGYAVPTNLRGNYFVEVNRKSPYGKNGNRMRELKNEKCGLCNE